MHCRLQHAHPCFGSLSPTSVDIHKRHSLPHFSSNVVESEANPLLQLQNACWPRDVDFRFDEAPHEKITRCNVRWAWRPRHVRRSTPHPTLRKVVVEPSSHLRSPLWRRSVLHEKQVSFFAVSLKEWPEIVTKHVEIAFAVHTLVEEERSIDSVQTYCRPCSCSWWVQRLFSHPGWFLWRPVTVVVSVHDTIEMKVGFIRKC